MCVQSRKKSRGGIWTVNWESQRVDRNLPCGQGRAFQRSGLHVYKQRPLKGLSDPVRKTVQLMERRVIAARTRLGHWVWCLCHEWHGTLYSRMIFGFTGPLVVNIHSHGDGKRVRATRDIPEGDGERRGLDSAQHRQDANKNERPPKGLGYRSDLSWIH